MEPVIIYGGVIESIFSGGLIGGLIASAAAYFFAPRPENQGGNQSAGRSGNVRSAETAQHVVYGMTTKGGTLFYINGTGDDNEFLHQMLLVAATEIEAVGDIRFNAANVVTRETVDLPEPPHLAGFLSDSVNRLRRTIERDNDTAAAELSRLNVHLGAEDQLADADAIEENENWTDDHRVRGHAYIYARLEYDPDVFTSFIPNITAEVFGKKIYDPRDGVVRWSMNPALIIADILESYLFVARENIDQAALIAAANVCDERVLNADGTESLRYTANGYIELDGAWEDWLTPFINAMAGAVVESGGTYFIHAGAWTEPVLTITDADFMGAFTRSLSGSDRERSNAAKGTFVGPQSYDEPTEYPSVKDAVALGEDGGRANYLELDLEMVNDHRQAQRVSNVLLQESRRDETMTVEVSLAIALDLRPFDNVRLVSSLFGFDETYRVIDHRIVPGAPITAELTLKRHDPEVYDWSAEDQEGEIQNVRTNLPGVGDATRPTAATFNFTPFFVGDTHRAGEVDLFWTNPSSSFAAIEVESILRVECRTTAIEGDPLDPADEGRPSGPWEMVTVEHNEEIADGLEMTGFSFDTASLNDGPYDFRGHVMQRLRVRARFANGSTGPWINASFRQT